MWETPTLINDATVWKAADVTGRDDWIHHFTTAEVAEICEASRVAKSRGKDFDTMTAADFPLPTIGALIKTALDGLERNRGMYLFRGFPALEMTADELRYIYWGLGLHLGIARSQSYKGDYLGDVKDFGYGRLYTTNQAGAFHVDFCDVVGLFVIRTAKSGGLTQICSSTAIHNEIANRRPDYLKLLYEPVDWSYSKPPGMGGPAIFRMPIFSILNGRLSCLYNQSKIKRAMTQGGEKLSHEYLKAMDYVEELAQSDEFQLKMMFRHGDLQLINNHVCIHGRTGFEDYDEPDLRRHLLRIWLAVANSRELHENRSAYGDTSAGAARGGMGNELGIRVYHSGNNVSD